MCQGVEAWLAAGALEAGLPPHPGAPVVRGVPSARAASPGGRTTVTLRLLALAGAGWGAARWLSEEDDLTDSTDADFQRRLVVAGRVFRGCLLYTIGITLLWLVSILGGQQGGRFFGNYAFDAAALGRIAAGVVIFQILWGLVWWAVKNRLLRTVVGLSEEERKQAFSARMSERYPLPELLQRYSERRIRIVDMIGRRGRFITILAAAFFFLYLQIRADPKPGFVTVFLNDNMVDGIVFAWLNIALFHSSGFLARMFFGPQTRIMDGTLGRANCLLIGTLWSAFKFILVPLGARLAAIYPPETFAPLFIMIWGAYVAADSASEIVGSLFGRQRLRVWGIGDVNRKSVAGTVGGLVASLTLCLAIVAINGLPASWIALAVAVSVSSTLLELVSPRGTDDITMATGNALICWAFGALIY
jgi:hypothetical protein